jgi:hypothetical protein
LQKSSLFSSISLHLPLLLCCPLCFSSSLFHPVSPLFPFLRVLVLAHCLSFSFILCVRPSVSSISTQSSLSRQSLLLCLSPFLALFHSPPVFSPSFSPLQSLSIRVPASILPPLSLPFPVSLTVSPVSLSLPPPSSILLPTDVSCTLSSPLTNLPLCLPQTYASSQSLPLSLCSLSLLLSLFFPLGQRSL